MLIQRINWGPSLLLSQKKYFRKTEYRMENVTVFIRPRGTSEL